METLSSHNKLFSLGDAVAHTGPGHRVSHKGAFRGMWLGGGCTVISGRVEIRFQGKSSSPRVEVVFLPRLGFVQSALSLIWGDCYIYGLLQTLPWKQGNIQEKYTKTMEHTINKSFIRYAYFNFLFWKKWIKICMVCLALRTYSNVCF